LIYVLPQQRRPDDLASVLDNKVALDHEGSTRSFGAASHHGRG
jgi:hypothetical protein